MPLPAIIRLELTRRILQTDTLWRNESTSELDTGIAAQTDYIATYVSIPSLAPAYRVLFKKSAEVVTSVLKFLYKY